MSESTEKLHRDFERDPRDGETFKALSEELFFENRWEEFVDVCSQRAACLDDSMEAARLYAKAASIAEDKLKDLGASERLFQKALDLEKDFRPALLGLREILERQGKFDALARVLEREAALASAVEKPLLFLQVGKILESRVGDIPRALEMYKRILDLQPLHPKALDALEKTYRFLGRWEDLRELLESVVAREPPAEVQARVLFKLGKLYENRFADPVRAARCLEMVRQIKPDAVSVYRDLDTLYRTLKNWRALVRLLEAEAGLDLPSEDRARCLKAAGEVLVEHLEDMEAAGRFFSRAAALAPDLEEEEEEAAAPEGSTPQVAERTALEEAVEEAATPGEKADRLLDLALHLHRQGTEPEEAARRIEQAFALDLRDPGRWKAVLVAADDIGRGEAAAAALKARADALQGEEAAALLNPLGDFYIERLGDRARGIRAFQQALKVHPDDADAVARLESHWEAMGHHEGLASLYRWQASSASDEKTKTSARKKLTRVLSRDPAKVSEAAPLLEAAVLENPADEESVRELMKILGSEDQSERLLDTLFQAVQRDPYALPARRALGQALMAAGRFSEAADQFEAVLDVDPADEEANDLLDRTLGEAKDYDRMAARLAARIRGLDNFEEKLGAYLELGTLYRDHVQSLQDAIAAFEDALSIDPANEEALEALEGIYEEARRDEDLIGVLERRAAFVLDAGASSAIYARIGEIAWDRLGDPKLAATAFENAAALDPENLDLLERLEDAYEQAGDRENLLRILRTLREATQDPEEAVRALAKAGELCEQEPADPEQAQAFYREVLDVRPDHVPALKGMQRVCERRGDVRGRGEAVLGEAAVTESVENRARLFLEAGRILAEADPDAAEKALREVLVLEPGHPEAVEALESLCLERGDRSRYVEMALVRLDGMEPGEERNAHALKIAGVLEDLGRREEALAVFSSVLEDDPDNRRALAGVRRVAESTRSHREAAAALRREIELAEAEERPALYRRLARILEEDLHDLEGALEALQEAEDLDPEGPKLSETMERLLVKTGREEELADLLETAAEQRTGSEKAEALLRAGEIASRKLFDPDRAIRCFSAALQADPDADTALNALKNLLSSSRRWSELVLILRLELERQGDAPDVDTMVELGLLFERHVEDLAQAKRTLQRALALDPQHRRAQRSLARVLERLGDAESLASILASTFEGTEDPLEGAAIALDLGKIHRRDLGDEETAATWYEKALELAPGHPAALSALEALYEKRGAWDDLIRIEETILRSDAAGPPRKKAICVRLGKIYEDRLGQLDMALRCYKSALEFDPRSLGALRGVQRVARSAGNLAACRKAFEREIKLGGEPSRLALLHQGVGILLEQEDNHAEALVHLEEASRLAPGNREILRDLIQLYEKENRSEELAAALERWAAAAPTGMERGETLLAAARVVNDSLYDTGRAIELLRRAEQADPRNVEVLQLLGNLLFARGDHKGVVEQLRKEIRLAPDRETQSRLLLRAASIYEDPLKDPYQSAECLQEAIRLHPDSGKGLKALKDLRGRLGPGALEERGLQAGIEKLLAEAEKLPDTDPEGAQARCLRVLDLEPANVKALDLLAETAQKEGKFRRAAVWLSMKAAALEESDARPSVHFRLGRLFEENLVNPAQAVQAYLQAWRLAPGLEEAADAVERLAPGADAWEAWAEVKAARLREASGREKAAGAREIARVEEINLRRLPEAATWIRTALDEAPTDPEILEDAARILEAAGDLARLAAVKGRMFDVAAVQGQAKPEDALAVARLYAQELHDPESACVWFEKTAETGGADARVFREWRDVCVHAGFLRDADRLILREIEAETDPARAAALHRERARLLSRELGDESEALRALKEAARLQPPDFEILSEMEAICRRLGRWSDLGEVLETMGDLSGVDAEKADFYAKAGDAFWERVSDFESARRLYRKALELDPDLAKPRERTEGQVPPD